MTTTRHRAQTKKMGTSPEQLRRLLDVLISTLDEPLCGEEIARRAHLGRFYFDHLVKAVLGESPAAFRRRLLLERAAYQLLSCDRSVTFVALDAGYGSVEAFTHAFNRAFGVAPREFRARDETDYRLPAPNGVHFHPGGMPAPGGEKRRRAMDLTDRMVEHDNWLTERLLDAAAQLSGDELDEPVVLNPPSVAFGERAPSIRSMLNRLVLAKEMWAASISGRNLEAEPDTSLKGMRERLAAAGDTFSKLVCDIRTRDAWDTAYVDAIREPPETNTFGAAVAHVLAWDAVRREIVAGALLAHGVDAVSLDPITWEHGARTAGRRPLAVA